MSRILFTIILISFFCCNAAFAQHSNEPKKIFQNNYANEVLGKSGTKSKSSGKKDSLNSPASSSEGVSDDFGFIEQSEDKEEEANLKEDTSYESQEGTKVSWIGGIVYASDLKHMQEKLSELSEQAIKYDLMVGPLFLVGDTNPEPVSDVLVKLRKRQAIVSYVKEIPSKYKAVKLSPTWIVQTEKGQMLLEALGPLRRNFNKSGEVVTPEKPLVH